MDISDLDCMASLDDSKADRLVVVVAVERVAAAGRPIAERFAAKPNDVGRLVDVGAYLLAANPSADRLALRLKVRVDAAGPLAAVAGRLVAPNVDAPNVDGFASLPKVLRVVAAAFGSYGDCFGSLDHVEVRWGVDRRL